LPIGQAQEGAIEVAQDGHARRTLTRSCAPQVRISVTSGWPTLLTRTWASSPCIRRVRATRDLPRSGLVDEPGADPELDRKDPLLGGLPRRILTLPSRAPDLTLQRERLPELDAHHSPHVRAPPRVEHHAQHAINAEPGVPEASVGVVHFDFRPRGSTVPGRQSYRMKKSP
jgi:hypothetical protein